MSILAPLNSLCLLYQGTCSHARCVSMNMPSRNFDIQENCSTVRIVVADVWSHSCGIMWSRLFNDDVRNACIAELLGTTVSDFIVPPNYMTPPFAT